MNAEEMALAKACCSDLYQSQLAQLVLGDTRHPGGLHLTNRLGRLMDLKRGDWVVDLASGNGTSALAISRSFHCHVVGIEYGRASAIQAWNKANDAVIPAQAWFLQGDAELLPLQHDSFDAVLAECSLSLFPNKALALREAASVLRSGGKLGISDVTIEEGCLPVELDNSLGNMLCLTEALDVESYTQLFSGAGFVNLFREDASEQMRELLARIKSGLGVIAQLTGLQGFLAAEPALQVLPSNIDWVALLTTLEEMIDGGQLGYWIYVGEKP